MQLQNRDKWWNFWSTNSWFILSFRPKSNNTNPCNCK